MIIIYIEFINHAVDDKYIMVGSSNINWQSMDGGQGHGDRHGRIPVVPLQHS
jgi:hypothetical protein